MPRGQHKKNASKGLRDRSYLTAVKKKRSLLRLSETVTGYWSRTCTQTSSDASSPSNSKSKEDLSHLDNMGQAPTPSQTP